MCNWTTVHPKLTQHCKSSILQIRKQFLFLISAKRDFEAAKRDDWKAFYSILWVKGGENESDLMEPLARGRSHPWYLPLYWSSHPRAHSDMCAYSLILLFTNEQNWRWRREPACPRHTAAECLRCSDLTAKALLHLIVSSKSEKQCLLSHSYREPAGSHSLLTSCHPGRWRVHCGSQLGWAVNSVAVGRSEGLDFLVNTAFTPQDLLHKSGPLCHSLGVLGVGRGRALSLSSGGDWSVHQHELSLSPRPCGQSPHSEDGMPLEVARVPSVTWATTSQRDIWPPVPALARRWAPGQKQGGLLYRNLGEKLEESNWIPEAWQQPLVTNPRTTCFRSCHLFQVGL